jgi:hypothetical protein
VNDFTSFKVAAFFDRPAVKNAVEERTRKALSRMGAFVRQRARQSMRRRKGRSPVGKPPSAHEGQLKDLLFFAWDRAAQTVVVGPMKFRRGDAPSLNEYGGAAAVRLPNGQTVRGVYKPRPFMAPALASEWPKLDQCFAAAGA